MKNSLTARGFISLLWNGSKAIDVLQASLEMGLLDLLDAGSISLKELSQRLNSKPHRLYKLLDCLESLGLVNREQDVDDILCAYYYSIEPLKEATLAVVGPSSIERDRDKYKWQEIFGHLPTALRGDLSIPREAFDWPPCTVEQMAKFETSMAAGCGPIVESFRSVANKLWMSPPENKLLHVLDVGGGDGTLACELVRHCPHLYINVYNLPALTSIVTDKIQYSHSNHRLGFIGGDFLQEPLPGDYDVILFVRVLHDWPAETARMLLQKAYQSLLPGGRVIICEEFRSPERLAIQFFWTYFLIGVDSCVSRLRETDFYNRVLREVGFEQIQVLPGAFDIIVAERPVPE